MKDFGIVALLSVVIAAAAPASDAPKPAAMTTQRSTEAFAECFAESQDREAAAWAYVPRKNGGTFSNLGAASVARPYFLLISDRGARREIQLQNAAPRGPQERGIMQCI
jgi:hypothetical protein